MTANIFRITILFILIFGSKVNAQDLIGLKKDQMFYVMGIQYSKQIFNNCSLGPEGDTICFFITQDNSDHSTIKDILVHLEKGVVTSYQINMDISELYKTVRKFDFGNYEKDCSTKNDLGWKNKDRYFFIGISEKTFYLAEYPRQTH